MPEIGQTLSHFKIVEKIGAGGMGTVFLAEDLTLDRKVALKFLPDAFTSDPERMARFEREAKLLASLNHPNIAGIYGLEQADGNRFLVLEYVEGETLQAKLSKGALPLEDALELCRQIAEGLEAAHEKGVIHRDLKPANVMITAEEKVKILDFGLAKAFSDDTQSIDSSQSPTLTEAMTRPGVILGTAAYMSPEQAKGKSVDKRADIWAFGCILYECLTGKRAFEGETVTETLAAILRGEPEWNRLPPNLHPRIRLLLERCLEKHSKDRCGVISDARVDIQKVLADPSGVLVMPVTTDVTQRKIRTMLPWIAISLIAGLIIAGVAVWIFKPIPPPEQKQVIRFYHELPEDQRFTGNMASVIDLSTDGTKIVYVANGQLYLRYLKELSSKPIQGTDEIPTVPIFSPHGQSVVYYSMTDGQWKRINVSGGAPVILCDADVTTGATWGSDTTILFEELGKGIMRVSADSGTAELLIEEKDGERFQRPQALPGGEWVLFTIRGVNTRSWDEAQIVVQSLKTDERRLLVSGGSDARYLPTGHLIYALGNVLYAKAFDIDSLEVIGVAEPIVEGVRRARVTGAANYDFSDTGMLAYVVGSEEATIKRNLVLVDRNGEEEPVESGSGAYINPRISPDGTKIAFMIREDTDDIWIWDVVNKNIRRLTFNESSLFPLWTIDGQRIAFMMESEDGRGIYWRAANGTGGDDLIGTASGIGFWPSAWSVDGEMLVTTEYMAGSGLNIGSISMEEDHSHKPLLQEEYGELQPQISPKGQWMAYTSDESGEEEIYVRPFPDVDEGQWQISQDGGNSPLWSHDGKELFYRKGDEVIAVSVETEPTFQTIKSETLFRGNYVPVSAPDFHPWDIHPDGKRFLMMKDSTDDISTEGGAQARINIVLNWFEELKRKVPIP